MDNFSAFKKKENHRGFGDSLRDSIRMLVKILSPDSFSSGLHVRLCQTDYQQAYQDYWADYFEKVMNVGIL